MTSVPIKKEEFGHRDKHAQREDCVQKTQGECHVKMKIEIKVLHLQAKELKRLPANHHKLIHMGQVLAHSPQKKPTLPTL